MLRRHDEKCRDVRAEKVVIFNSRYAVRSESGEAKSDPLYSELSRADFVIRTEDEALRERFEAIKKAIAGRLERE